MLNIKSRTKKKKGNASILTFVQMVIIVFVFAFTLDLIVVANQYMFNSRLTNEVARQIAIQSGIERSTPQYFPGGNDAYATTREILNKLEDAYGEEGIEEFHLSVNGVEITPTTSLSVDKGEKLIVEVAMGYKWTSTQVFMPNLEDARYLTSKKVVYGEYHDPTK